MARIHQVGTAILREFQYGSAGIDTDKLTLAKSHNYRPYQEYAYDGYGNLILVSRGTAPGNVTTSVEAAANPLNNQLSGAQYDPAGRMISSSPTSYSWDVLDQLAKVDGTAAGSEA